MALAAKIPYDHPYAGGFPGIGSQPLPTDSDCLTYLAAVKAADGAGVETGVAVAVDAFVRDLKATPGLFDAIKASCILCGARTLSGALVPLAGTAPTNNNFVAADYTRGGATPGLKGDGSTKYLDSNRATSADPEDDNHAAVYATVSATANGAILGNGNSAVGLTQIIEDITNNYFFVRNRSLAGASLSTPAAGLAGVSRSNLTDFDAIAGGVSETLSVAASGTAASSYNVFARWSSGVPQLYWDGTAAFYSIGTDIGPTGLAALDTAVSNLTNAIGAAV